MERRQFLQGVAAAAAVGTAGCLNVTGSSGPSEVEWEYEWEPYVGSGLQAAVIVTGEIENVGDGYVDKVTLECQLLAGDGSVFKSRKRILRNIEAGEEQHFYWTFRLSDSEMKEFDSANIEGSLPDQQ